MRRVWAAWFCVGVLCNMGCAGEIGDDPAGESEELPDEVLEDPESEDAPVETIEPEPVSLSQSTGSAVVDANVNCRYGDNGPNAGSSHFRVLDTAAVGGAGTVVEAILPIEVASSPDGVLPATLRIHRLTGDVTKGEFDLLAEETFDVMDQTLGEVRVPISASFAAGESLVVEAAIADGGQVSNFRFGYNLEAQSGPTYMASDDCGLALPVDLATLDNPFAAGETFAANSWLVTLVAEPAAAGSVP